MKFTFTRGIFAVFAVTLPLQVSHLIGREQPQPPGDDWLKSKDADGNECLKKKIVLEAKRPLRGTTITYRLPLSTGDELVVKDDGTGELATFVHYEAKATQASQWSIGTLKKKDGTFKSYGVTMGNYHYMDFNADGIIDAFTVTNVIGHKYFIKCFIRYQNREVEVRSTRAPFLEVQNEPMTATGLDDTAYEFVKDSWQIKK
jgi:hypothetical protein